MSGILSSGLLAALYLLSFSYKDYNDIMVLCGNGFQLCLTVFVFGGLWILFYAVFGNLCMGLEKAPAKRADAWQERHLFFIGVALIVGCRLPWLLMNYPGSVAGDTIGQLAQWFYGNWDAHHPPLSSFLLGSAVHLGEILYDRNFGIFVYLFMQMVLGSLVCAYSACFIYRFTKRLWCYAAGICFWAITPIWGVYAQWLQKDMLYSLFAVLHLLLLIQIVEKKKVTIRDAVLFAGLGLLVCLLRKNGIYIILPSCAALIILLKSRERKRIIMITIGTFLLYLLITDVCYPSMGIRKGSVREALSVPMQQTARYLRDHYQEVTEEEFEAINGFCYSYESMPEVYDPQCADPVKDIVNVEIENPGKYFLCWTKMFFKHPGTYFAAFMNMNYGYLAPVSQNVEPDLSADYHEQLYGMGFSHRPEDSCLQILQKLVFINITFPGLRYLTMPGFYTWIIIICMALLINYKKKKALIPFIPSVMTTVVCLASPLCNGMRYQLPVVLAAPMMIAYTWYKIRE